MVATSKNIQGNTELTLIAPLKPGLSPKPLILPSDYAYPTRLYALLTSLFGDRKRELESNRIAEGLLEELQIIHSVQWMILPGLQPHLMLAVTFDGPWEPYIRVIVERGGPLLDMIFSHCSDYNQSDSCMAGYQGFSRWVRAHQIDTPFLFAATPTLTTEDTRFLQQLETTFAADPARTDLIREASRTVLKPLARGQSPHWLEKVYGLAKLRVLFGEDKQDALYFDRMAIAILSPEFGVLDPRSKEQSLLQKALKNPEFAPAVGWFQMLYQAAQQAAQARPQPPSPLVEDRTDVQGSLLTPYGDTTHGCMALLRFRSRPSANAFFETISGAVTTEPEPGHEYPKLLVNFGLTIAGLRHLEVSEQLLAQFPQEFHEGLEQRAGMLGDVGHNSPRNWTLPRSNWPAVKDDPKAEGAPVPLTIVDAVLMIQTNADAPGHGLLPTLWEHLEKLTANVDILHVQPMRRFSKGGHFNLIDGISQPAARGDTSAAQALPRDQIALGELLLGYANQRGESTDYTLPELFRNSTFMALRNMTQDVEMYDSLGPSSALALGRTPGGVSLETPDLKEGDPASKLNDFGYLPPEKTRCPFFAHARRANPRTDETIPRILRRGMTYGPQFKDDPKAERGLLFIAYAASLAEQYEVVQRWVNAGNSTGVMSNHPDVIAGPYPDNTDRKLYYANALGRGQLPLPPRQPSTLKWGFYAFVPSRSALQWLANDNYRQAAAATPTKHPAELLKNADVGPPPNWVNAPPTQHGAYAFDENPAAMALKVFLEGSPVPLPEALTYWRSIQEHGGVRPTPFATMVASRELVREVLVDPKKFSVRSYYKRMTACAAESYLGMDPDPAPLGDDYPIKKGDYEKASRIANPFVASISREEAFAPALAAGRRWLKEQPEFEGQVQLDLVKYARTVIRDVGTQLFDLPDTLLSAADNFSPAEGAVRCPFDLTTSFLHIFPPRPSQSVSDQAATTGPRVAQTLADAYHGVEQSKFIQTLRRDYPAGAPITDEQKASERRTLLGVLSGFAVPTYGHLLSTLVQLVGRNELWRLQREHDLRLQQLEQPAMEFDDVSFLYDPIYECMIRGAVPERLHRIATEDTPLGAQGQQVTIKKGDLVAVSIAAAAQESAAHGDKDAWKFLFGDLPQSQAALPGNVKHPVHACPAQDVAIGVLVGALLALLEHQPLLKSPDPSDQTTLYSVRA